MRGESEMICMKVDKISHKLGRDKMIWVLVIWLYE